MKRGTRVGDRSTGSKSTHQLVTGDSLVVSRLLNNANQAVRRAQSVDSSFNCYSDKELNRIRKWCVLCGKVATYFANSKNFCYRHREDAMREMKAYGEKKYGKR